MPECACVVSVHETRLLEACDLDVVCARSAMCTGAQACTSVRECASARTLVAEHFQKSERS